MNTHAELEKENKSQSVASAVSKEQSGDESAFQIVDNRTEAAAQRKLRETVNNSSRIKQAAQFQLMADNYSAPPERPVQYKESNKRRIFEFLGNMPKKAGITSNDVVQRMPGDYGRIGNKEGKKIAVSYKEGSKWLKLEGPISSAGSTSLYIGAQLFVEDQVNGHEFKIITMPHTDSGVQDGDIDAHRPDEPWTELGTGHESKLPDDTFGKKRRLLELVHDVVMLVKEMPVELQELMPHDDIFNMTPEGQLEYCVHISKGSDAGVLAKCLYTSYFYAPINNYLRQKLPIDVDEKIINLIIDTLGALEKTLDEEGVIEDIENQRVELQAEWMGDPEIGDDLNFPAFTSMHAAGGGLKSMLSDIGAGTFGEVTKVAVLNFRGRSKTLVPVTKYFDGEKEVIVGPGMKARITHIKDITVEIPNKEKVRGKEYTLEIVRPLREIYPGFDEAAAKESAGARALKDLGHIEIPTSTPIDQMAHKAMAISTEMAHKAWQQKMQTVI